VRCRAFHGNPYRAFNDRFNIVPGADAGPRLRTQVFQMSADSVQNIVPRVEGQIHSMTRDKNKTAAGPALDAPPLDEPLGRHFPGGQLDAAQLPTRASMLRGRTVHGHRVMSSSSCHKKASPSRLSPAHHPPQPTIRAGLGRPNTSARVAIPLEDPSAICPELLIRPRPSHRPPPEPRATLKV
jgi:hypothetical protein